jgi:Flp pilus assembly CpaE family ATPase
MTLAIISVRADARFQGLVEQAATALHIASVHHFDHYISPDDVTQYTGGPDVVPIAFVSIDDNRQDGFETAEILRKQQGAEFNVIIVSSSRDGDLIIEVLREGKYGFLALPATSAEVITAIKRAIPAQPQSASAAKKNGKVYVFAGVSGGAGNTTIAVNLAVALAESGKKTLLVDHHRMLGHAGLFLGLPASSRSFYDLIENAARIDASLLSSYVIEHGSGLDVLCSPEVRATPVDAIPGTFKEVVAFLRTQYECVIFDSRAGGREAEVVCEAADRVFFVVSAEVAPMRDLLRYVDFYGKDDAKFQIVVNHEGRSAITANHISDNAGLPVAARFPHLNGTVAAAVNAGRPVSPDVQGFREPLGALLNGIDPREFKQEARKGWFSWGKRS